MKLAFMYFCYDKDNDFYTLKRIYSSEDVTTSSEGEEYKSKEYLFLKKNWKLFVMNRNKLNKLKRTNKNTGIVFYLADDVDRVLKKYLDLNLVYQAKVDFFCKGHSMYWFQAKTHLDFFINQFSNSLCPELKEIGKTLSNWYEEIKDYDRDTIRNIPKIVGLIGLEIRKK